MPIRYVIEIEHLENGQTSMSTKAQQRGEVVPHETFAAIIVQEALKAVRETIAGTAKRSTLAEGDSAKVLRKIIEENRRPANRLPDEGKDKT